MAYGSSQARSQVRAVQAYATATEMPDLSHICDLCHSLHHCQILNLLSKARDRNLNPHYTSRVCNPLSHNGNSRGVFVVF